MIALVMNVGSTTLKYACIDTESGERLTQGIVDRIGQPNGDAPNHEVAAKSVLDSHATVQPDVVGHRIVHGGECFSAPAMVTPEALKNLATLDDLAPLHNPPARAVVEGLAKSRPELKQVMVFDTAYFTTLPPAAYRYALPVSLYTDHGVRRYGAHGTSHQLVTKLALAYLAKNRTNENPSNQNSSGRIISLHLGGGASVTASIDGIAQETSMGMTPLEGLVMATRSGDLDPAVPLFLVKQLGMTADQASSLLNQSSGLIGLCGDADMRTILKRRDDGDPAATLAIDVYVHRLVKTVGGYVAVLGGVDAIVFTAGVGENASPIRSMLARQLQFLGLGLDEERNAATIGPRELTDVSSPTATVRTLVIPTDEEFAIARKAAELIDASRT
ncbi:acetate kinase [Neorhodopirellula lusitana]|uniref:Acetate kinase n=1 Tax=Neorhodopirellula lusitana TaxID=445327 RepID=A0ABY1PTW8_9BACT|nr:acetate/propionate family kinase [Neorhodopirellula lusitana]SMP47245.1 acetate kinase [Neorhodopirellula lusitana]